MSITLTAHRQTGIRMFCRYWRCRMRHPMELSSHASYPKGQRDTLEYRFIRSDSFRFVSLR